MWKSFGDKYEIIPHNEEKHPRKIKGINRFVPILFLVCFVVASQIFRDPDRPWFFVCALAIMLLFAIVVCPVLFFLKWKYNNKECDFDLIGLAVIFALAAYLSYPYALQYNPFYP